MAGAAPNILYAAPGPYFSAKIAKVARYRHAQLSAIKLAGDINAKVTDSASLDELIAKLKGCVTQARADY
jgi:hypothetical protein